ncbi:DNA binding protein [Bacillus phage Shbh1]|uniref:Integration host factor-like protein n=1 Tax=Bacillus phage Shbh1 TaxID=1796992 RepID=A0A142F1I2_9CAUD|nr:DNA binding protein [Bacillus phage Shbh1]AMQ66639.1 integration host factor-like protein [Bacillus phage Shbh1]
MTVNRKEIARRIAYRGGYNIGDIEKVLELYEDVVVGALEDGDEIKQGKLFKIIHQELPEKRAWDGLNKKYFIRPPKKVLKFKPLVRVTNIELPVEVEEDIRE